MTRVGFIGTGAIATALARGLAGRGHAILATARGGGAALAAALPEARATDPAAVVAGSDVVFLCLPAAAADATLAGLPWRADHRIVSVMLGVSLDRLRRLCAPATEIAVTIPLPGIAQGGCPLPTYPASPALEALYGDRNPVITLAEEAALNPHFAATALASVVLAQMATTRDWLAALTGDAAAAERYVAAMMAGSLGAIPLDGRARLDEALAALSIEGGLNATLRAHMSEAGALDALREGLDGFRPRLGLPAAD